MTTKQTIDGVHRDTLDRALNGCGLEKTEALQELRALLDAPASVESLVGRTGGGMVWHECAACRVKGSYHPDVKWCVCGRLFDEPAAHPQGEPMAILSGPDDSVCWTQSKTPHWDALDEDRIAATAELRALLDADKVNNRQMGLMQFVDAHPIKPASQPQVEPIYQLEYLGEGGGGWNDVDKTAYDRFERLPNYRPRIVYAEQPAPVAVAGNRTAFEIEHDAEPGDEAAFRLWRQERLNTARPAHANPPPGTEPSGTHHDNDGLDEWRKP